MKRRQMVSKELLRGRAKIDVARVDCAQGGCFRKSIAEHCGTQNFQVFVEKVNNVVEQLGGEEIERVQDVFCLAEVVKDA